MTNNVLNYIYAFLNLRLLIKLYKQFLDCSNIIYNIIEIKKPRYKKPNIFVLFVGGLSAIPKTIIFVDSINKKMALSEYLRTKFLDNWKNKTN